MTPKDKGEGSPKCCAIFCWFLNSDYHMFGSKKERPLLAELIISSKPGSFNSSFLTSHHTGGWGQKSVRIVPLRSFLMHNHSSNQLFLNVTSHRGTGVRKVSEMCQVLYLNVTKVIFDT